MSVTAANRFQTKRAQLGGDQEGQFESAFSSLAFGFIKDKAPRLLDYLVGFQLVERNEDNTKAIGVFGFKLGNRWAYAPVFFVNSNVKGHELLYLKDKDMFVPLKENWVNYVLAKRPHVLGEPESKDMGFLGVRQPDYQSMSIPPSYKQSSLAGWQDWALPFAPVLGSLTTRNPLQMEKYAKAHQRLNLDSLLKSHYRLAKLAYDASEAYPAVGELIERFHGPDFFNNVFTHIRDQVKAAMAQSVLFAPKPAPKPAGFLAQTKAAKVSARSKVRITVEKTAADGNDTERDEQLAQDGYIVEDERETEEVSTAYTTQSPLSLANPGETGIYDVLAKKDGFAKCLIVAAPRHAQGRSNGLAVVRLSPKDWLNAAQSAVFAKPNSSTRDDFRKWYDEQSSRESLSEDKLYLAITENGDGSAPFRVIESVGEGRYRVAFRTYMDIEAPDYMPTIEDAGNRSFGCGCGDKFVEIKANAKGFKALQDTLYVPESAKFIALQDEDDEISGEGSGYPFKPGNLLDVKLELMKTAGLRQLRVYVDGMDASINRAPMISKLAALFSLIRDHGLREDAAREVIKLAEAARGSRQATNVWVKYADEYGLYEPGPQAPPMPEPTYGMSSAYGNVPTLESQESYEQIPDISAQYTDPSIYDNSPDALPDPNTMQQVQQAGQTGQKEVFDTSMMNGLLKAVRQDTIVDQYLPDLLKALDCIGRLIFSFNWHNEEFADRYGQADMPELEDTLRNNFDALGDLTLFLEEKAVTSSQRMSGPRINEAAGN